MEIKVNIIGDKATLRLAGMLNVEGAPILRDVVNDLSEEIKSLVINFRDVGYVSSAGLRELLICNRKYGKENVLLEDINDDIEQILKICGFNIFLTYTKYVDESRYIKMSFADFIETKAKENGMTKAFQDEKGEIYTWSELNKAASIMAKELEALGIKTGSHVGLCSQNSVNYVIAFFAIQKLGAFTQLINNQLTTDELAKVIVSGDVEFFCYGDNASDLESYVQTIKRIKDNPIREYFSISSGIDYKKKLSDHPDEVILNLPKINCDQPALMIFTSGSSGTPKAVLLSSYNILNAANNMGKHLDIFPSDKLCLILPLFHVFGLVPCLFAHAINNSLVMLPPSTRTSTLLEFIALNKCTHFNTVPTMMIAILNNKDFSKEKLASLKTTVLAGASATEAQILQFKDLLPNDHFIAAYGLSEIAPVTITNFEDSIEHITKTVGHAVDGISIKIADPNTGKEMPLGVDGEILVQGFNLMVGYYKLDPSLQVFDEEGYMHTGDAGHLNEDGYLVFTTRIKEMIIRGGENIIPSEVAASISKYDGVSDVKVFGIPHDFYGELVGACLVLKDRRKFDKEDLNAFLSKELVKYKIPVHYEIYDSFPMLSNGKIDTQSLKKDFLKKVEFLKNYK